MRKVLERAAIVASLATFLACSGSSGTPDGGRRDGGADGGSSLSPPSVSVTANPASSMTGQSVTFTAAITGGSPPYASCTFKYSATEAAENASLSGSTCTGTHTYAENGDYVVTAEVIDNANRRGVASITYTVGGGSSGDSVDLVVRDPALVNPPANNRYRPGGELRVSFKVRNQGLGSAGASVARVSLRNFGGTETALGDVNVAAIGPQGEQLVTGTFNLPGNQAIGSYDLLFRADATMVVSEDNEDNNLETILGALAVESGGDGG
jgi:hypothetical protein